MDDLGVPLFQETSISAKVHTQTRTFTWGLLSSLVIAVLKTSQEKENQINTHAR